jgi:hypothetical protein
MYLLGYNNKQVSEADLVNSAMWQGLDPEFARRLLGMMRALNDKGILYGIGGALRSTDQQRNLFLYRHNVVDTGGCCGYEGKRYALKPNVAHAAPPGKSYHEPSTPNGKCLAADMVGDHRQAEQIMKNYGLRNFATVNNEPWHFQPLDIPTSRSMFSTSSWPLPTYPFTINAPTPMVLAPPPTVRLGSRGTNVKSLQQQMKDRGWYMYPIDGDAGPKTVEAIKQLQRSVHATADGVYGPITATAWGKALVTS